MVAQHHSTLLGQRGGGPGVDAEVEGAIGHGPGSSGAPCAGVGREREGSRNARGTQGGDREGPGLATQGRAPSADVVRVDGGSARYSCAGAERVGAGARDVHQVQGDVAGGRTGKDRAGDDVGPALGSRDVGQVGRRGPCLAIDAGREVGARPGGRRGRRAGVGGSVAATAGGGEEQAENWGDPAGGAHGVNLSGKMGEPAAQRR